jgi:hypothetical protein
MAYLQDFINHAGHEYDAGKLDQKIRVGEVSPKVLVGNDGETWYLEPKQPLLFQNTAPEFIFDKWSIKQWCERISPNDAKMDYRYIRSCGGDLGLQQMEFWNEVWEEREAFLRLRVDPNSGRTTIRAALSSLYQPIDAVPVGKHLLGLIGPNRKIEYQVTDSRWFVTFWEDLKAKVKTYGVGFRVMGSEIGAMGSMRFDVLLNFQTSQGDVTLPIMVEGNPLCTMPYSGTGAAALSRLDLSLQRGLHAADNATDAVEARKNEALDYPADEYYEIIDTYGLPTDIKGKPVERPELFKDISTKFELACLLGRLASETSGRTQLRIESAAGLYLLTGKARNRRNRNQDLD